MSGTWTGEGAFMRKHTARGTENGKNLIQGLNAFFQRPSLVFFVFRLSGLCSALQAGRLTPESSWQDRCNSISAHFLYFTPAPAALCSKKYNPASPVPAQASLTDGRMHFWVNFTSLGVSKPHFGASVGLHWLGLALRLAPQLLNRAIGQSRPPV